MRRNRDPADEVPWVLKRFVGFLSKFGLEVGREGGEACNRGDGPRGYSLYPRGKGLSSLPGLPLLVPHGKRQICNSLYLHACEWQPVQGEGPEAASQSYEVRATLLLRVLSRRLKCSVGLLSLGEVVHYCCVCFTASERGVVVTLRRCGVSRAGSVVRLPVSSCRRRCRRCYQYTRVVCS